ncbi:amino acid permease [candidate division CSSED10-310 bacterium]|uniref:Amino acid permease n=1 Tax=candidate division CSSED10-310 bacterium TaxID=2855610 RepID=A0ABV6YVN7_UNCC1
MNNEQQEEQPQTKVTFARGLGLFDATMIGVGAMIGAGIFVLTGLAAGVAGPAAILAFALNGVVTLFTAFSYAELASAIPEAGGGYSYIKRAFPAWIGFLSGWMLWFAYTVACALYALGFGSYFWEFFHKYTPHFSHELQSTLTWWPNSHIAVITVLIGVALLGLNYKGSKVTGQAENVLTMSKLVILTIFIGFGLWQAYTRPDLVSSAFSPFFANGVGGVLVAMGLTFIAFEGYDLIATVSEEVQEPEKNIPRAIFISLGITIVIYLLIIFVAIGAMPTEEGKASWQILGEKGETAIVEAAKAFMPAFGVAIIVFGGLLSTMSALNATILASSRVVFTMGRDRYLPKILSSIHPKSRTPHIAIVVSGVILLALAVSFDVTVVGSAASVMFLLTFTLVNLSVLVLRSDRSIKRLYTLPFYPWPPLIGAITSIFLAVYQLNLGPEGIRSWTVSFAWIVTGLAVYFAFFRRQAMEALPQIIVPFPIKSASEKPAEFRVLVPVYNPDNVHTLVGLACQLAKPHGEQGEVIVVSVVEVARQLNISEGLRFVHAREPVLKMAEKLGRKFGVRLRTEVRVAHDTAKAILQMAKLERVKLLLLGWRGYSGKRETVFGSVVDVIIEQVLCDLLVVKFDPDMPLPMKSVLLPTAGGPNARFAASLASQLLEKGGLMTLAGVIRKSGDEHSQAFARKGVADTIAEVPFDIETKRKLLYGDNVPQAVVKETSVGNYDALLIGATKVSTFKRTMFGQIPEQIARDSHTPVILVKHFEGAKSWLNRFLGS